MIRNPELLRNMWLELSPSRLVTMPLVIGAIFFINYLVANNIPDFLSILRGTAFIALGLLLFLLGIKEVSESIINEVNNRTWDSQRMTSIGPWEMALGKLFGSALYAWYGSLFCIAAIIISSVYLPDPIYNYKLLITILLSALMIQAASLCFILTGLRKNRARQQMKSSSYIVLAFILLIFFLAVIPQLISAFRISEIDINWYHLNFSPSNFILSSIIIFLGWSLIGLYRNMRLELQFYNGPWVWVLFLASLMLYANGFLVNENVVAPKNRFIASLYLSYAISLVLTYLTVLGESKYIVDFRLLLNKFKCRHWKEFQFSLPMWLITLAAAVLLCLATLIGSILTEVPDFNKIEIPTLFPLTVLFFLLRDVTLLIYVNLKESASRADVMAVVYLLVLYVLGPLILSFSGLDFLVSTFLPNFSGNFLTATLPVLLQCLFLFYLVKKRWKILNP